MNQKIDLEKITFITKRCSNLTGDETEQCSKLFSEHYGIYSKDSPIRPLQQIKLSPNFYNYHKLNKNYFISLALDNDQIIGQAFYLRKKITPYEYASWVVQLVVHTDYRRNKIGTRLLYSIWGFSDDIAWGLATTNPCTVKTLESSTFRSCDPKIIKKNLELIKKLDKEVHYISQVEDVYIVTDNNSLINSNFHINQEGIDDTIKSVYKGKWKLGNIRPGHEWLAFTFRDQEMHHTKEQFQEFISHSEKKLKDAYSRMDIPFHPWAKGTKKEVDYIIENLNLSGKESILDLGCGMGRHSFEFQKRGYDVVGVDFVEENIKYVRLTAKTIKDFSGSFIFQDCRTLKLDRKFDVVLCLYDVVGSFPKEEDNFKILQSIASYLNDGGRVVLSVMNMELTESIAKYRTDIFKDPNQLLKLKPSDTMKRSGDIFKPDYFLIDTESGLLFRKEQFSSDGKLSSEYIIRDKRYKLEEIYSLVEKAGLKVIKSEYVQAGKWNVPLVSTDKKAKEILIIAK